MVFKGNCFPDRYPPAPKDASSASNLHNPTTAFLGLKEIATSKYDSPFFRSKMKSQSSLGKFLVSFSNGRRGDDVTISSTTTARPTPFPCITKKNDPY